ncbi:hypothetical protein KSK37_12170 [Kaistella sp. DKR-2]|uniref:GxxExxY protein n=1 Tax=Kaistella soli TaxID=2849654 RepID=UPI001C276B56|nr:GxxExxY protein [Kaistella soli]MBU8883842.1 hypothetical protein [Kaistella soli]
MDIIKEIQNQISTIKENDDSNYLDSIFNHINRAEYYYLEGKNDNNFFNDVIYRSNQAFEGALKESFKVLAGKTDEEVSKKTPNEIESYFEKENIFRERVLQLFKNYRQEWRNKSTHDFKLFFDESEAFLALINVSSFVHLLLKQIQEKIASNIYEKILEKEKEKLREIKENSSSKFTAIDKAISIIIDFIKKNDNLKQSDGKINEYEIIGYFSAYLDFLTDDNISVQREPKIKFKGGNIRPDFIIEIFGEKIIIEIKKMKSLQDSMVQDNINQMLKYLELTKIQNGIIFNINFENILSDKKVNFTNQIINQKSYNVAILSS